MPVSVIFVYNFFVMNIKTTFTLLILLILCWSCKEELTERELLINQLVGTYDAQMDRTRVYIEDCFVGEYLTTCEETTHGSAELEFTVAATSESGADLEIRGFSDAPLIWATLSDSIPNAVEFQGSFFNAGASGRGVMRWNGDDVTFEYGYAFFSTQGLSYSTSYKIAGTATRVN